MAQDGGRVNTAFSGFALPRQNSVVIKINSVGVMLFATYAGPGPGGANGIAVDSTGVYVTGVTGENRKGSGFTGYAGGDSDLYILKLSPTGVPLYRTMIGGSQADEGNSIAVDSRQSAWVAGVTRSADLHQG